LVITGPDTGLGKDVFVSIVTGVGVLVIVTVLINVVVLVAVAVLRVVAVLEAITFEVGVAELLVEAVGVFEGYRKATTKKAITKKKIIIQIPTFLPPCFAIGTASFTPFGAAIPLGPENAFCWSSFCFSDSFSTCFLLTGAGMRFVPVQNEL